MALVKLHSFTFAAKHIKELKISSSRLQEEKLYKPQNPKFSMGERPMDKNQLIEEITNILKSLEEEDLKKILEYIKNLPRKQNRLTKEMAIKIIKERICLICKEKYVDFSYDTKKKQYYVIHYRPQTRYCYIPNEDLKELIDISKELELREFIPLGLPTVLHSVISGYDHEKRDLDLKVNDFLRKFLNKFRDLDKLAKVTNSTYTKLVEITERIYKRSYIDDYAVYLDFDLYLDLIKLENLLYDKGICLRVPHLIIPVLCYYIDEFYTKKYANLISLIKTHTSSIFK